MHYRTTKLYTKSDLFDKAMNLLGEASEASEASNLFDKAMNLLGEASEASETSEASDPFDTALDSPSLG